jgi:hypothetical protein
MLDKWARRLRVFPNVSRKHTASFGSAHQASMT